MHAVQPLELLVVEGRRARADAIQREALDQLLRRHLGGLVVVRPAEQREEVHQRLGDVAGVPELVDRLRAVALGELLAVVAEHVRDVRVDRQLVAERSQDLDLLRRVRDVVVAADHVRDRVVHVLDGRGEVVGRAAVRADEHDVLELLVRELDPAPHRVFPARHTLVGHAEADRAFVLVGLALRDELVGELSRPRHRVELERDRAVPVDPEPLQRALDLVDRLGHLAARVGVLDAEQALAALAAREQPVEEERAHPADVQEAGRRGRHSDPDGHAGRLLPCSSGPTARAGSKRRSTGRRRSAATPSSCSPRARGRGASPTTTRPT